MTNCIERYWKLKDRDYRNVSIIKREQETVDNFQKGSSRGVSWFKSRLRRI